MKFGGGIVKSKINALTLALLCSSLLSNQVHAVPQDFEDRLLASVGSGGLTDLSFTDDGKLLVAEKFGKLLLFDDIDTSNSYSVILDISNNICINGENGLGSVTVHPSYDGVDNQWVYIYYTYPKYGNCNVNDVDKRPVNRVARFKWPKDGNINVGSEQVLIETGSTGDQNHNGGDIWFGVDGLVYISIGDAFGHRDRWSQDNRNLFGTIVRITDDGDVPPGNPYATDGKRCNNGPLNNGTCSEIYASGLRNPWKFAMDPNSSTKVRFFINDVGAAKWEDISEGGDDFKGANYGWPDQEGPCRNGRYDDCPTYSQFTEPIHFYQHNEENEGAVTGAAFVPNGIWPANYNNAYLYADYVFGHIYIARYEGKGCRSCFPPTSNYTVEEFATHKRIVSIGFGKHQSTQALYYITRGPGTIRRIKYLGNIENPRPNAVITSDKDAGPVGVQIKFDAYDSNHPLGNGLTYRWDFDGNLATIEARGFVATYFFTKPGKQTITLTVTDTAGGTDTATKEIMIGEPPKPQIDYPPEGATFAVGDVFTLRGSAVDENDTELDSDTALTWEVRQKHHNHFHPFLDPTVGNNIQISPAPLPEDFDAATNSNLEILLTATDENGITGTVVRNIMPRIYNLEFESIPSNRELMIDNFRFLTPVTIPLWEGQPVTIEAPFQYTYNKAYHFDLWSNGGTQEQVFTVQPPSQQNHIVVATFKVELKDSPVTLLKAHETLESGKARLSDPRGYFLELKDNGRLELHHGMNPDSSDGVAWATPEVGKNKQYFAILQGDGNLLIHEGTSSEIGKVVWRTDSAGMIDDYFLQYDSYFQRVAIMKGTEDKVEGIIWSDDTRAVTTDVPPSTPTPTPVPTTTYPLPLPPDSQSFPPEPMPSPSPIAFPIIGFDGIADPLCQFGLLLEADRFCCPHSCGTDCGTCSTDASNTKNDKIKHAGGDDSYDIDTNGILNISDQCCSESVIHQERDCSVVGPPCFVIQHSTGKKESKNPNVILYAGITAGVVALAVVIFGIFQLLPGGKRLRRSEQSFVGLVDSPPGVIMSNRNVGDDGIFLNGDFSIIADAKDASISDAADRRKPISPRRISKDFTSTGSADSLAAAKSVPGYDKHTLSASFHNKELRSNANSNDGKDISQSLPVDAATCIASSTTLPLSAHISDSTVDNQVDEIVTSSSGSLAASDAMHEYDMHSIIQNESPSFSLNDTEPRPNVTIGDEIARISYEKCFSHFW